MHGVQYGILAGMWIIIIMLFMGYTSTVVVILVVGITLLSLCNI